jgi:predicted RNA-binding Zn ribbon-like protein
MPDMSETVFELSGGALCLDFANTTRPDGTREDLPDLDALLRWAEQAGVLGKGEARAARLHAASRPRLASEVLARARALRGAVYRAFAAVAAGERVPPEDVATIAEAAGEAAPHYRLVPEGGGFVWKLSPEGARSPAAPVWAVARSAAELLTSRELSTVRECALDTCAWLFLDRSKNQKRRWCDMKVCGNRSKARRHYARTRRAEKA